MINTCICILALFLSTQCVQWLPQILWTYSEQEISQQSYEYLYHLNRLKYAKQWEVRILTNNNYIEYIRTIPNLIQFPPNFDKFKQSDKIDLIKIIILAHYGGVWMDYKTFLVQDLNWLQVKRLRQSKYAQNVYGQAPKVVLFRYNQTSQSFIINETSYLTNPKYAIWFIAASSNTTFLNDLANLCMKTIQKGKFLQNNNESREILTRIRSNQTFIQTDHSPIFTILMQQLLEQKQKQIDSLGEQSPNLAVWQYSIWHINVIHGPYIYLQQYFFIQKQPLYSLTHITQWTYRKQNIPLKYFVQLRSQQQIKLTHYFETSSYFIINLFKFFITQKDQYLIKYFCKYPYRIRHNSVISSFLIGQHNQIFPVTTMRMKIPTQICYEYQIFQTLCIICLFWVMIAISRWLFIVSKKALIQYKNRLSIREHIQQDIKKLGQNLHETQEIQIIKRRDP